MRVSYLAISDNRCAVQMAGCNFNCRGCFSKQRKSGGVETTAKQIAEHIPDGMDVMIAGGEPTLDRDGLVSFVDELGSDRVTLSTNGYLLDDELLESLRGVTVHIDLKALDSWLHHWYTGMDNAPVLEAIRLLYEKGFDFEVSSVYMPGVVEAPEIENIARFLSGIGDIRYKVMRYVPVNDFSRRPQVSEIENAVRKASEYIGNVSSSIGNRSHPVKREVIKF